MKPLVIHPEADRDLKLAEYWYNARSSGAGKRFNRLAFETIERIEHFPNSFGRVWRSVRAVKIPRHMYVVYYINRRKYVEVLAVLHGHRNIESLRRRFRA
jgi:plasmid stabilization system protein ParE